MSKASGMVMPLRQVPQPVNDHAKEAAGHLMIGELPREGFQ